MTNAPTARIGARPWVVATALLSACLTLGCSGDDGPPTVRTVRTEGPTPATGVLTTDAGVVARDAEDALGLLGSPDGIRWKPIELPHAPVGLDAVIGPRRTGGLVEFAGVQAAPEPFITPAVQFAWASDDGRTWWGGRIAPGDASSAPVLAGPIEGTLLAAHNPLDDDTVRIATMPRSGTWATAPVSGVSRTVSIPPLTEIAQIGNAWSDPEGWHATLTFAGAARPIGGIVTSPDRGRHWSYRPCPSATAPECATRSGGAGLLFRGRQVSTDGGRHWERFTITPTPDADVSPVITPVHHGDEGWLAVGDAYPIGDRSTGFLLTSTDGVHWRSRVPDRCAEQLRHDRPNSAFTPPARLDGRWWSLYTCRGLSDPVVARLLVSDGGGRHWQVARQLGSRPVVGLAVAGDHLVVPIAPSGIGTGARRVLTVTP